MGNMLVKCAVSDFAIQWSLFAVAAALQTEKFYDLAGEFNNNRNLRHRNICKAPKHKPGFCNPVDVFNTALMPNIR